MEDFLKSKNGKKILIAIMIVVSLGLIIFLSIQFINFFNQPKDNFTEESDPSGKIIYSTNAEPEQGTESPLLIGFDFLYDFGFTAAQQVEIENFIHDYFSTNYPDFTKISYIKDSFGYPDDVEGYYQSYFKVQSNTKEDFLVTLDTEGSLTTVKIKIDKL